MDEADILDVKSQPPARLTPEDEQRLYQVWEEAYHDLAMVCAPLGFVADHYVRVLRELRTRGEEVKRVLYLDPQTQSEFLPEIPSYYRCVQPLVHDLSVLWMDVYNEPSLFRYFRSLDNGSPILWDEKFRPRINPIEAVKLPEQALWLLERYVDAQWAVIDYLEVFPFREDYREDLVSKAFELLTDYLDHQKYRANLARNRESGAPSDFFDAQNHLLHAELQVSHASFRVFPADVIVFQKALGQLRQKLEDCRNYLFIGSRYLAKRVASRYARVVRVSSVSEDDLYQEGCVGLMRALYRFRYRRGSDFPAYATWWVKQTVKDYLSSFSGVARLPIHQAKLWHSIRAWKAEQYLKTHVVPTNEQIAAHFSIDRELVEDLHLMGSAPGSLDAPVGGEENDRTVGENVTDDEAVGPREGAEAGDRRQYVQRLLGRLKAEDRQLLEAHFGFGGAEMSLRDIAEKMSERPVTREAVRQRLQGVFRRVKQMIPIRDMSLLQELFRIKGGVDTAGTSSVDGKSVKLAPPGDDTPEESEGAED